MLLLTAIFTATEAKRGDFFFPRQLIKTSQVQRVTSSKEKRTIFAGLGFSYRVGFRNIRIFILQTKKSSKERNFLLRKPLSFFAMLRSKRTGNRFD